MAERRMFAKSIIDSDTFIDMPTSTRLLYFDLSMRADDDGFVNSPKKIMRMTGASQDDLKMLIAKSFLIPFESGVVVIKHWKIHNYIQKDRYKETIYVEEKALLHEKENKEYTLDTDRIQDVYNSDTQVRLGKVSLEQEKEINNNMSSVDDGASFQKPKKIAYSEAIKEIVDYLNHVCNTNYKHSTKTTCEAIKARLKEGFTVDDFKTVIDKKFSEWGNDPKMVVYLRPQTLFGTKFEGYLNQPITDGRQLSETDKALMRWLNNSKEEPQEQKPMLEGDLF